MNIKNSIELSNRINKKQVSKNAKWSSVPKDKKQCWKTNLPSYLELPGSSNNQPQVQMHGSENIEEDEQLGFEEEISANARKAGLGWHLYYAVEKRVKDAQNKPPQATTDERNSESDASFTTARTTNSETDNSFSSAVQDFQYLNISDHEKQDENVLSEVVHNATKNKDRYKRNALMKSILQARENNLSDGEHTLTDENVPDLLNDIQNEKENWKKDEPIQNVPKNKKRKFISKKSKSHKPIKDSIRENSKQKGNLVQKKVGATEHDRKYYMEVPDKYFFEFVSKKSM